jgi:hypothetical protein
MKETIAKRGGESEVWLDYYAKYQFMEFYRKRVEELELVETIVESINGGNRKIPAR